MTLDQLLQESRSRRLVLSFGRGQRVVPSFNDPLPRRVRDAIRAYNQELAVLIRFSDVRVCANPDLHRSGWYHCGHQVYRCKHCSRLLTALTTLQAAR